jgi:hypothetical protein
MDQIRPLFFKDWIDTLPPEKFRFAASNCRPTFDSTSWNRRVAVNNWYGEPDATGNAIGCAKFFSCSPHAVIAFTMTLAT